MQSKWSDAEAQEFVTRYAPKGVNADLAVRTYTTRLLGSDPKMVLHGAFSQVGIGLALGIPAAVGAGVLMSKQLFQVRPWDPVMLAAATLLLAMAALLASSVPAWRAAGV